MKVNYIYCDTNPDQKLIAQNVLDYNFIKPVSIYDTTDPDTLDWTRKTIKGLRGDIIVQWSPAIKGVEKYATKDWFLWCDNSISGIEDLPDCNYIASDSFTKNLLLGRGKKPITIRRVGPPYGKNSVLGEVEDNHNLKVPNWVLYKTSCRVGIPWGTFFKIRYEIIIKSLVKHLPKFELFINATNYRQHTNTLTVSDILEKIDEQYHQYITFTPFEVSELDLVVAPAFRSESTIVQAIRAGVPCIAHPTPFAQDIRENFGAIITASQNSQARMDLGMSKICSSHVQSKIVEGLEEIREISTAERMKNLLQSSGVSGLSIHSAVTKGSKINVFGCFRNNETSLGQTLGGLKAMEHKYKGATDYYFFENDSNDTTPALLADFFKHSNGKYACEKLGNTHWPSTNDPRRIKDLSMYRNKMKALCDDWSQSDYSFIIDSEVIFDLEIMSNMLSVLEDNPDIAMVTPFGTPVWSDLYYDTFAYRPLEGDEIIPPNHHTTPFEVRSAFAGFVCIRTKALELCHWESDLDNSANFSISEHVHFCDMVRRYGKIVIDPRIRVYWKK